MNTSRVISHYPILVFYQAKSAEFTKLFFIFLCSMFSVWSCKVSSIYSYHKNGHCQTEKNLTQIF